MTSFDGRLAPVAKARGSGAGVLLSEALGFGGHDLSAEVKSVLCSAGHQLSLDRDENHSYYVQYGKRIPSLITLMGFVAHDQVCFDLASRNYIYIVAGGREHV